MFKKIELPCMPLHLQLKAKIGLESVDIHRKVAPPQQASIVPNFQ